jgi:hypothetical protein
VGDDDGLVGRSGGATDKVVSANLVICAAVEASQGLHAPALDSLRATRIGHLVLGSDFDPRDLLAYALGIAAAALLEVVVRSKGKALP